MAKSAIFLVYPCKTNMLYNKSEGKNTQTPGLYWISPNKCHVVCCLNASLHFLILCSICEAFWNACGCIWWGKKIKKLKKKKNVYFPSKNFLKLKAQTQPYARKSDKAFLSLKSRGIWLLRGGNISYIIGF